MQKKIGLSRDLKGENFLKKRHFKKIPQDGRVLHNYSSRSIVVVPKTTPL